MKLSLCITTYNRSDLTFQAFKKVLDDDRISEIIIVDDCSEDSHFQLLKAKCFHPKITLHRNVVNLGMSRNKAKAISLANNEWCIIFDSDNVIDPVDYVDAFYKFTAGRPFFLSIYCPDFAKPNFNYQKYSGQLFDQHSAKKLVSDNVGNMLMNTCNYIVHRDLYRDAYRFNPDHKGSDTVWFNYTWLKTGGMFQVVPGMQYNHLVHDQSGFMQDANYNMAQAEKVRKLIMQL